MKRFAAGLIYGASILVAVGSHAEVIDLSGEWTVRLDPQDVGESEQWFQSMEGASIQLPGCLQEQGVGNIPGPETIWWGNEKPVPEDDPWMQNYRSTENFKTQQFLLPDRHYIGAAWYKRDFVVPEAWSGKRVSLFLERCHWQSQVWVDGCLIGANDSLATPHIHELGSLSPGRHRLALRIDNSAIVDIGRQPHSVSEQTAGTWNGVVGRMELRADDPVWIDHVRVFPHAENNLVHVIVRIGNLTERAENVTIAADVCGVGNQNRHDPAQIKLEKRLTGNRYTEVALDYPMGENLHLWDEFTPNRYRMEVVLVAPSGSSQSNIGFGVRDFRVEGRQFCINGTTTFLRGNTDCAVMPKTGYAPMDLDSWRKVWKTYRSFGLNMARFHSWCPPEAAFQAADEIGIYLASEVGEWAYIDKQPQMDFLRAESMRILETYGHHPSFVMMALGNESGGEKKFFSKLIDEWKAFDASRAYSIKANSNANPANLDYEVIRGTGKQRSKNLRYQGGWPPRPEGSEFNIRAPQTSVDWRERVESRSIPVIQHESAQFCAYPDLDREQPKYTGYLKASYLDIARDQLNERGMLDQVSDFVEASGQWQMELTREEFEAAFRTPELAGFNWLSLADFTGQTTAPVGFTDAFYDPKPYVDPAQVRRWNAPTVLLARMDQRVLTKDQQFAADIEVSHYGKEKLNLDDLVATLRTADGAVIKTWRLPGRSFGQGSAQPVGKIALSLESISAPAKLNLLVESPKNRLANDWDLWIYPDEPPAPIPPNVHVAYDWDAKTRVRLRDGETVLMLPKAGTLKGQLPSCFTTFYWTSFGTRGGQSSACGILLNPDHPLFRDFPTEFHSNWQWWDLLTRCQPMILDSYDSVLPWPKSYRPLVQPIDSWKINRKLALVAEAKVGDGKLLVCSIDIENELDKRPATRQFRKSLFAYLESSEFNPDIQAEEASVDELFGEAETESNENTHNLPSDG